MKAEPPLPFEDVDSLPAVLTEDEAAKRMGMKPLWFEVLAKRKHVHCLGGYESGCARYYATIYILSLKGNLDWLDEAFRILREDRKDKNSADIRDKEGTL